MICFHFWFLSQFMRQSCFYPPAQRCQDCRCSMCILLPLPTHVLDSEIIICFTTGLVFGENLTGARCQELQQYKPGDLNLNPHSSKRGKELGMELAIGHAYTKPPQKFLDCVVYGVSDMMSTAIQRVVQLSSTASDLFHSGPVQTSPVYFCTWLFTQILYDFLD